MKNEEKASNVKTGSGEARFVSLLIKAEKIERAGETGFAVYDGDGKNVGLVYKKKDDGIYKFWVENGGVPPKKKNAEKPKNWKNGVEWSEKLPHGNYDVEAAFYEEFYDIYGDNRKIYLTNEEGLLVDFGDLCKKLEETGESELRFFRLQRGDADTKEAELRAGYRKIEAGVFWVCGDDKGATLLFDKGKYVRNGKKYVGEKVVKDEDGINYKPSHKKAWEAVVQTAEGKKYAAAAFADYPRGRIWYDKEETCHYVMFDSGLSSVVSRLKKELEKAFDLISPEYIDDGFYKAKKIGATEYVIKAWKK